MKERALLLFLIGSCSLCLSAAAFESAWTDQFGESTYTISGPDAAAVGDLVRIVITASDPFYPEEMVAGTWSFWADGNQVDGGFAIFLAGGTWERSYDFVYDTEGIHDYLFRAQDLGHGGGGHNWEWFEIGGTTQIELPTSAAQVTWGTVRATYR